MKITRLDLDGKGSGSPEGLVALILKNEVLTAPVPIEELAHALDIKEIAELETAGFEGGLLTDQYRSQGIILVNRSASIGRRRFTIGHELAHFLLPTHKPIKSDRFLCSREDMTTWTAAENATYQRMELEANKFAALILVPPPLLRPYLAKAGDPRLETVLRLSSDFLVSKDVAARAVAHYSDDAIAVLVVKDGCVARTYRNTRFPRMCVGAGDAVPDRSIYRRQVIAGGGLSEIAEADASQWLETEWGVKPPLVCEQVLVQSGGYAMVMLSTELPEDEVEDVEEGMTAQERYRNRQASRQR